MIITSYCQEQCDFFCIVENTDRLSVYSVRKILVKAKSDHKTFNKSYSLKFIDSVRLMNDSFQRH